MATLDEFIAQVTADVENEKPLMKAVGNDVIEFTEDDYNWVINNRANDLFWQQENGWIQARQDAYGSVESQLDMIYWDGVNGTTTWQDHIAQVKLDNPKP